MTRRQFLFAPAAFGLLAQERFPGVAYRNYSRCLPDYLRGLAARAYETRNSAIARLTTQEAIADRQRWVRETFWRLVGGMPERTPLNARSTGSFERPGYRLEKVVYESRPRFYVTANLYLPTEGAPPYPAVLFQMGHSQNGKAADTYQRCCQALARFGYVVLAFDPMGQGERIYYPDRTNTRTRLGSADDEHTVPGRQMLLLGDTSTRLQVWDAIRSLDYLAAHPMVDPKRIGATGQSGGGTLTMMLAAVDDRIAAAAVCSGNTENVACADFNPPGSTDDAEQNFIDSGPAGFDRWDTLYPFAPKPLLISVSDKDFFGTYSTDYISNGWEEYQKLKRVYDVLGRGDLLAWTDTPLPHGLAYDSRLQVYNWFGRHLRSDTRPVTDEPPVSPERDEVLRVLEPGPGGFTPFTMNKSREVQRTPAPLAAVDLPAAELRFSVLRAVPSRDVRIEAAEIASAPNVWLPVWIFRPKQEDVPKPALLVLEPGGRNGRWEEGGLYQQLAARGFPVCAADVRGIGDLTPEMGRGHPKYARSHNDEENYAWASMILGKPLLGQRVTDILALAAALRASFPSRRLGIAALGKLTVPALFAAAVDSRVTDLYLAGGLVSFRSVADTENYSCSFGSFAPDLLKHTDLPEVAASLAPRRLCLAGTVNAAAEAMSESAVSAIYPEWCRVRPAQGWDFESLSGWFA